MQTYDYDLFVIGGGSGGVRAARLAGSLGKRVALAEKHRVGGTCVIRGCVPKKLFVYASEYASLFEESIYFGWKATKTEFNLACFMEAQKKELTRLEGLYRKNLCNNNVAIFDDHASLLDEHTIFLKDSQKKITAEKILITVGGRPYIPSNIKGIEYALTSDDMFALTELPKSLVVVGSGYIGLEFASIFHSLGVEVTVISRGTGILRDFDKDLASFLQKAMQQKGIKIITQAEVIEIIKEKDNLSLKLSNGQILKSSQILLATGRVPEVSGLGLENVGIKTNERGNILVNEYFQTNVKNIFALGDVTNKIQLTPVAIHQAICFIKTQYQNIQTTADLDMVATVVFSKPELATVGLSEENAVKQYKDLEVYHTEFRPMRATISNADEKYLMKLLVEKESNIVVGAHIAGPNAGEMIQLVAIALKGKLTKNVFDATMAVHPTAAEELVTLYKPSYVYKNGLKLECN